LEQTIQDAKDRHTVDTVVVLGRSGDDVSRIHVIKSDRLLFELLGHLHRNVHQLWADSGERQRKRLCPARTETPGYSGIAT
ncbi:unnamed protein product, partial [Candidula unifasciata]